MSRASGVPDMLQRNRNTIPDLLKAMLVKVSVKDGKISNFFFFLVGYDEEKLWWPIQSPNKGRKKKVNS